MIYAQLDENNICVGVSNLSGEVNELNIILEEDYDPITKETTTIEKFVSRMIEIPIYSSNFIGLKYLEDGEWGNV